LAEATRRFVLYLDSSQLGSEPEMIKERLQELLRYAEQWGVIIHFDSADDFLAARTVGGDRESNMLSALLFRELERFTGVIFLTTIRVGNLDQKASNLFTLVYTFPDLTREDLKTIWRSRLKRLHPQPSSGVFDMIEQEPLVSLRLNGRGMYNILSAALALAAADEDGDEKHAARLHPEHVITIAEMQRDFTNFLEATLNKYVRSGADTHTFLPNPTLSVMLLTRL
jgi:hypothetical protein